MQSGASFRLTIRRGPQPNHQYPLTRDTMTIGRDITNDVVINDPEVSRHHARLVRTATGYTIEDLRSTNGVFVNRTKLQAPHQLVGGDLVGLGETVTLVYETSGGAESATIVGGGQQEVAGIQRPPAPPPPAVSAPAPQPAYQQPPPAPYAPAVASGYDDEEEYSEDMDRNRMIMIGCAVLTVTFCCALVIALIAIDNYENGILWCEIPFVSTQLFECP